MRTLECIKAISTAVYVTCDHVVWAGGAGAVDKRSTLYKVCDKLSLMGWAAGSALMAAGHVPDLIAYTRALRDPLASDNKRDDDADEWELREELEEKTVAAALHVASGLTQALCALSPRCAPHPSFIEHRRTGPGDSSKRWPPEHSCAQPRCEGVHGRLEPPAPAAAASHPAQ